MKRLFLGALLALSLSQCGGEELIGRARVRVMTTGFTGDGSLGDLVSAGVIQARGGVGPEFELEVIGGVVDVDEARSILRGWVEDASERDLLILSGLIYEPVVREAQCDFGGASVLFTGASSDTCSDVRSISFQAFEPSYLAGVAALGDPTIAPTGRVGIIAGADIPQVREVIDPFRQAVEARGGTVEEVAFIADTGDGFFDPSVAAQLATDMAPNVDVILALAGPSGIGVGEVLDALPETERTYLIGAETDYSVSFAAITLGSVLRRTDIAVRDAILEFTAGQLSSGNVEVGFRDRLTEFVLSPTYGWRPIGGGCSECDLFDTVCLSACETLTDLVDAAEQEALDAARMTP